MVSWRFHIELLLIDPDIRLEWSIARLRATWLEISADIQEANIDGTADR